MGEERIIPPPPPPRRREREILSEAPAGLATTLWQELRHLRDWAESPPEVLGELFHSRLSPRVAERRQHARACSGELVPALDVLWALTDNPLNADRGALSAACAAVAEWAVAHECRETAVEWAELAAQVDPENPRIANLAGRVTRNAGEHERAELWFRRGIGWARRNDLDVELIRGHLGHGILCQELGRVRAAMRHFNSGSRLARKEGLEWLAAEVQHDLMLLLTVRGRHRDAERHAGLALKWYGKRHERFPLFAADVALLLVMERNYAWAARLAKGTLRHVSNPAARSVILALHARAMAGAGLTEELDLRRRRILNILREHREREAVALWHLAAAERLAGRWTNAEATAERAVAVAQARDDRETLRLSQQLLAAIRLRKQAPPPAPARRDSTLADLVHPLVTRLAKWSPERRGRSALRSEWAA